MLFRAWISIEYLISSEVKQHSYQHDGRQVKRLSCESEWAAYPLVWISLNVTDLGRFCSRTYSHIVIVRERAGLCRTLCSVGTVFRRPPPATFISLKRLQKRTWSWLDWAVCFIVLAGETSVAGGVIVFWGLFGRERGTDGCESCDYLESPYQSGCDSRVGPRLGTCSRFRATVTIRFR